MCGTAGRACIVGNLWGDKASAEGGRIYLRCMIQRLCLVLMVLGMGTLSYAQTSDNVEDAAAFLKEMERKASDVGSGEAKWIRRDFSYAFEKDEVGEERRQEFIRMVRFLETNRIKFSTATSKFLWI